MAMETNDLPANLKQRLAEEGFFGRPPEQTIVTYYNRIVEAINQKRFEEAQDHLGQLESALKKIAYAEGYKKDIDKLDALFLQFEAYLECTARARAKILMCKDKLLEIRRFSRNYRIEITPRG